ncbi:hypothetical protein TNCV_2950351 [Trichonephila clavipes]|nr:hypothetical protein TNCV_2950351 [Trichonephila clavipes]
MISNIWKENIELPNNKATLIKKFPLQFDLPGKKKEEKEWCNVCLGSKLYNEIYDEPCDEEVEAYHPLLSIVSHLKQPMVKSLLKYLYRWFLAIDMHDSIARWIFSLLMCLEHPINEKCQNLIGDFRHAMIKRLRVCDKADSWECRLLTTIIAILDLNFRD